MSSRAHSQLLPALARLVAGTPNSTQKPASIVLNSKYCIFSASDRATNMSVAAQTSTRDAGNTISQAEPCPKVRLAERPIGAFRF